MGLETTVVYINDYSVIWPLGSDDLSEMDNHLRLVKQGLSNTFPNIGAAVTANHDDINLVSGLDADELSRLSGAGEAIANYSQSVSRWLVEDPSDKVISSLDVGAKTTGLWYAIGPPDVTVNVTVTFLSDMPADAAWIDMIVHITNIDQSSTDTEEIINTIHGRVNGSSTGMSEQTMIGHSRLKCNRSSIPISPDKAYATRTIASVPLSNRKFDIGIEYANSPAGFSLYVVGWHK